MADLYVNGVAMSSLSWWLETSDAGRTQQPQYTQSGLWSRRGTLVAGVKAFAARTIMLEGAMVTAANTVQGRVSAEDTLADALGAGLVTVRLDDGTTPAREIDGLLTALDFERVGHPLLAVKSTVKASLLCPEGDWRASAGTALAVGATPVSCPLGTAPSAPVVRIAGSATNPQILYRTGTGYALHSLTITGSAGTGDYFDIDMGRGVVLKYTAGVESNVISAVTVNSGSFPFALDPADGNYTQAQWPTLTVSSGNGEVLYTQRYR